MTNPIHAASAPERHATVTASAGAGKTWLLVTRLIRLLLAGVRPDAILAITFTRKAAAEMQTRLNNRLFELARCSDTELITALQSMGVESDEENCAQARGLYETLLRSEQPLKISTFHAFCQELLQRFPLEAGVSPGFELAEQTAHWQRTAWQALLREATETPDGALAGAMLTLFDLCGGLHGAETALTSFLEHRSDWWAYSEGQSDPVRFAIKNLATQLEIDPNLDPVSEFFSAETLLQLHEFVESLVRFSGNPHHLQLLQDCLNSTKHNELHIRMIREVFLTQEGTPRKRLLTKAQATLLGATAAQRFAFIFEYVCERLAWFAKHTTLDVSRAWFTAGSRYLDHYQRLKAEQGLLDFSDLEWQAYRLLNRSDHALWVQYKLDQRIDHLLIDEFQDTNPTQWHLILPLLEELAAGPSRERSVFLVGDHKQSIYRFRRADPHLFTAAQSWLEKNLQSESFPLHASWRSATAIIECVNRLFSLPALAETFSEFETHITHRGDLWGRVELLPLITISDDVHGSTNVAGGRTPGATTAPDTTVRDALRNPLLEPRVLEEDIRHLEEGRLIARCIQTLIATRTLIGPRGDARPVTPADIIILLRNRTHAQSYEAALREAGIPYLGAARGTLLESLEVQDMLALLDTLITPYDNLALAQVLRSPLFACSDADLMRLAEHSPDEMPWDERLKLFAPELNPDTPLYRAHHSLTLWRALAGRLPVHDLLDRIYCEGNVMARFEAAFPAHLAARVRGNLTRFIELALELDSGRYPSLPQFRAQLRAMAQADREAPDDATAPGTTACVRIMTIHAAKGLESPVVFLADAGRAPPSTRPYQVLIEWPSAAPRPTHFLLSGKKEDLDTLSMTLLERHKSAERREDANLLYVALTRAQQLLFISGCAPNKGSDLGWYGLIQQALSPPGELDAQVIESGKRVTEVTASQHNVLREPVEVDADLAQPILFPNQVTKIAPSRMDGTQPTLYGDDEDGRLRGIVIHRMLEKLTALPPIKDSELLKRIVHEYGLEPGDTTLQDWWSEACGIIRQPQFSDLYDPARYLAAYNEVPVSYQAGTAMVHGVIDRLVVHSDRIIVIDYKTHVIANPDNLSELAEPYRTQLHHYGVAAGRLWPEKPVRTLLLFTACSRLYEV